MPPAHQKKAQQFDFYKYLGIVWRRKWLLIMPLAICIPAAIGAAWLYPTEFEAQAVLELQDNRPLGEAVTGPAYSAALAIMSVKTRAMNWAAVREIVLSRKVDFGREVDPDDHRQLEKIYGEVDRRTRVVALGRNFLAIAHRSTSPERNSALVNEIVKKFVGEDRREAQDRAKADLKYYRDKLASAKTALADIDNQTREFNQQYPWLTDTLSELHKDYKDAETKELTIRQRIKATEETLADLRKELAKEKPEIVRKVRGEVPAELIELRKSAEQAKQFMEQINSRYTPVHPRWQEAKAVFDKKMAELKEKDKGDPEDVEVTEPNPKYAPFQARVVAMEKDLEKLGAEKLDANKSVSELYIRQRKGPELLGERMALVEQRQTASTTAADYATGVRSAEKEMARLLSEAYSSRFKVIEYARDDRRPVKSTQMKILALGFVLGLLTGAALIGLTEYLDQTFKSLDDARDYLGIPALGVIPAIFTPRDHRRKLLFRILAISSAVFVVGVAVAIYLTVPATKDYLGMIWQKFQQWMEYS